MPYHYVVGRGGEEGHRVHYRRFGTDDATHKVLLTMGLGGDSLQWEEQIAYFSADPDFQVIAYDNRGVGHSDSVGGRWTTSKMASDALSLLDHLGWKSGVHIVGVSMGGMITQEIARQDTPRFASLTLLSTIAGGWTSLVLFVKSIPTGIRTLVTTFTTRDPRQQLKSGLKLLYPEAFLDQESFNVEKQEMEPNFKRCRRALIMRGVAAKEEGMAPAQLTSVVKQALAVMTHRLPATALADLGRHFGTEGMLVVTGDEDILVHMDNATELAAGLGCPVTTLPGAGHGAIEQCAADVNAAIKRTILDGHKRYTASRL